MAMNLRLSDNWRRLVGFLSRARNEIGLAIGWFVVIVLIGHGAFEMISQEKRS